MFLKATENDRACVVEYCAAEPQANLFLLADVQNFGFDAQFQEVWMQKDAEQKLQGVLLRYYENYLYYAVNVGEHLAEVANELSARNAPLLSAKPVLLDGIAPHMQGAFERHDKMLLTLSGLDKLVADPAGLCKAVASDAPVIAAQYRKIAEFAALYPADSTVLEQTISNRIQSGEGEHWLVLRNGEIIAHANSTAETDQSGVVGGVFSLPECRRQGLAKGVVSAVCRSMLSRGKTPTLFFDNPSAGQMYYSLGFEQTGAWGSLEAASAKQE
ncbi:MAG: GNAT family N-acetyltransferase [Clostridiales bacterium]|nr:GNAT family N-acetyltransferase [Clostridiales bacterium]